MKNLKILAAAMVIGAVAVPAAQAATVGFELNGHAKKRDYGKFSLVNTSTDADISSMTLTIGKTSYNFDIVKAGRNSSMSLTKGDKRNGKRRFDDIAMSFDKFAAGESLRFRMDIDKDRGKRKNKADYSKVLFNNGKARNAQISVTFSNGEVLTTFLDDQSKLTRRLDTGVMREVASAEMELIPSEIGDVIGRVSAVPLPAALPLMLGGLFGLGLIGRRRKV